MTAATQIAPIQPPSPSTGYMHTSGLSIEVAKCLKLVAPASMNADAQLSWIASAVDSLEDIRVDEVRAVSAEVRRSVTRPAQIVPEIARLVAQKRARLSSPAASDEQAQRSREFEIDRESRARLYAAKTQPEIEEARAWERQARITAGLHVPPLPLPFTRAELDGMKPWIISMGIKGGFLERRNGVLYERPTP